MRHATALPAWRPLHAGLEDLARRYDRSWLSHDPLAWPHRFEDPGDREVVAVLAALLAYGRVATIHAAVERVLAVLGPHPAREIDRRRETDLQRRLVRFRHRWTTGADVAWLLASLARIRRRHGTLGTLVAGGRRPEAPLRTALAAWHEAAHGARRGARAALDPARRRARAFLLPDPPGGTAVKRLCLLARWCVRGGDGLDLGLWAGLGLRPADLVLPLDVHAHALARCLGLTDRPRPDWRAAEEVTAALRVLDPVDPVRFDFALVRPGMLGRCRYRPDPETCPPCPLRRACRHGRALGADATTRTLPSCVPESTPSRSPAS